MFKQNKLHFFLSFALIFIFAFSFGQEICNNGIDDDGDGFVDCYDNECLNAVNCDDDFVAGEPICKVEPTPDPTFDLKLQSASPNGTASGNGMISIGDIDGDGFPEIVTVNYYNDKIFVLDGRTSAIKHQRDLDVSPYLEVMIADINGDGCAEIFFPYTGDDYGIMSLSCDLSTVLWQEKTLSRPGNIGVADFDGDGKSELYARDEIFDAHTGDKFHASQFSSNSGNGNYIDKKVVAGGVAVDILADGECGNCDGQELVLGGLIYSVDINRAGSTASLNLEESIDYRPVYYSDWKQNRTATSVADYNLDGFLDVIMPGKTTSSSLTRIFFWDVKNNTVQTYADNVDNWKIGAGRPNIADIDGNGQLNITFVSGPFLYALNEDMSLKWKQPIIEGTSGTTGTTVFDFNGDGEYETVYRDENFLYIVNGNNGAFYTSVPCRSLTYSEYPIVADVNNDGATEICVTCITSNTGDIWDDIGSSQVRVFESKDDKWVPARKLWNQHAYFNVNVNDDLTIPRQPQKHHLVWSSGICGVGETRPLNSFLNQSPFITDKGCPNYAAPDLNFAGNIVLNTPQCPDTDFTISFDLANDGDKDIQAEIPITFYDGDPQVGGATKLNTVLETVTIPKGTAITVSDLTVQGPGTSFTLYIAINHDGVNGIGGAPPTPIGYPSGGLLECLYDNNIGSIPVIPTPFPVSVVKVRDNGKCDASSPDNGEARAFVLIGGAEVTVGYTFNWYNAAVPAGPVDYSGTNYANLPGGTYSVVALNDSKMCSSDTVSITINDIVGANPDVVVNVLQQHSNCNTPDGSLQAIVDGGADPNGYDFEWYVGNNIFNAAFIVGISDIAINLTNQLYSVVVTDKITGCQQIANGTVTTTTTAVIVAATKNSDHTSCGVANGSASANVAGATAGYTFNWYDGPTDKPTPDFTGVTYANLTVGTYSVTAMDNTTGCISDIQTINIGGGGSPPVLTANVDNHETSCAAANGTASADVGGVTDGYTFNWFSGQNTDPANELAGSPSASVTGLGAGIYTVLVTEDGTGCSITDEVTIQKNIPAITITPSIQNSDTCIPPNGILSATAAGGIAPYTFLWYIGNVGSPNINTPDFTGQTITAQAPGDYTIVVTDASGCASNAVPVEILDVSVSFNLSTTFTDQTSCDAATPNGTASATFTGTATDFDFEWRSGSNNTVGAILSTNQTVTNRNSGIYTLLARNINTGCIETANVTIGNDVVIPSLTSNVQDMDVCVVANGAITIGVSVGVPADYTFTWYDGSQIKATGDYTETSNVLSTLPAGFYSVSAVNNVRNCNALSITNIEVIDVTPIIQINQDAVISVIPNDCNDTGTIKVDVSAPGNTGEFDIEWFNGVAPFTAAPFQSDNTTSTSTATNLLTGIYTVVVTNLDNGCEASEVYDLPFSNAQSLSITDRNDAQTCPPNDGYFEVTLDISAPQTVDPTLNLADFNLRFFEGTFPNGVEDVSKRIENPVAVTLYNNLVPGDYYVIAFSDPGLSIAECPSVPAIESIADNPNTPHVNLTAVNNNTSCETPFNGILEIDINNGADPTDYNITWHRGASTADPIITTTANNDTQVNQLQGGSYTISVIHTSSACGVTTTYSLIDVLPPIDPILSLGDKVNCDSDGSVSVTDVAENGINVGTAGHAFTWLESDGISAVAGAAGTAPAGNLFSTDTDYVITAERGLCNGATQFSILDVTENPKITSVNLTSNTECVDAPNGGIALQIDGIIPAPGVYDIIWTGLPGTAMLAGENTTVSNLPGGTYDVNITRINAPNRDCTISAQYIVEDVPPIVSLTVEANPNTNCSPNNGSINNVTVSVNGVTEPIANYNVEYFTNNIAPLNPVADVSAMAPNTYYARATHLSSSCRVTNLAAFEVVDETINPTITLLGFEMPVECATDPDDLGVLNIALGNQSVDISVSWSVDGTTLPNPAYPTIDLSDSVNITGLPEGVYSVTLINSLAPNNNCTVTESFNLTPAEKLSLIADASPVTTCMIIPDGSVSANILNADNSTFNVYWFSGTPSAPFNLASAVAGSPSYQLSNLSQGFYTAVAVSTTDTSCMSDAVVVEIIENIILHDVVINEDAALVNCDPARPNGQLSATANGQVSGYIFEWYNGTDTSGIPDYIGNTYGQLTSNIDYTVVATDIITECTVTSTRQVTEDFQIVSTPDVTLVSNVTSCISPNGSLSATVEGSIDDHSFEWFLGTNTSITPIGINALIEDLDVGEYTVRATNIETGCFATNTGAIIDERIYPVFDIIVTNSSCMQSNGSIIINPQPGSLIDSIQWVTPTGESFSAPTLSGFPEGLYEFIVYGPGGCPVEGQVNIMDDIIVYNGISTNSDQMNDFFLVECLENFENNTVKIYNRAGQIVYEASFYDNDQTVFAGEGNKGIYLSGKEVPDGTYFYIVDKGDGSDPKTGYLELTR